MIRSARQLKDKIRNLAADKAADAQILLRSYMMERLLERISCSAYREKFILKGGMLVASMVGFQARSTMDMDATVSGETISVPDVRRIIEEISLVDLSDGVSFAINSVSEIMDEAEYPGVRAAMTAYMDGVKVHLKVDISTGDVITPPCRRVFLQAYARRPYHLFAGLQSGNRFGRKAGNHNLPNNDKHQNA